MAVAIAFFDVTFPGALGRARRVASRGRHRVVRRDSGVAVASLIPNADARAHDRQRHPVPDLFISGVFFPIEGDAFLGQVGDVFPVRHFVNTVFAAFDPASPTGWLTAGPGTTSPWSAIWGVVGAIVAVRFFRWDPRRK